jgi:glutamate synthase domain-containing protein 3
VVAKVRERLAISKQEVHKFGTENFNLRVLNDLKVRKQYQIKNSNRFAALENLSDREGINRASDNNKQNIKIIATGSLGLYELRQHNPSFDEECFGFLDQKETI